MDPIISLQADVLRTLAHSRRLQILDALADGPRELTRLESPDSGDSIRRHGRMEQVVDALARALGNGVGWLAESGVLFVAFAVIWVAFGAAIVWSQGSLDAAWHWIRGLPILVQGLVWLLFLPVVIGLWVWETTWPLIVRLVLVASIAGWNLLVFLPRALQVPRP